MERLRSLIRIFFSLAALLLLLMFLIRILAPGTPESAPFFQFLRKLPFLDQAANLLTLPVDFVLGFVTGLLPADVRSWFPTMKAGPPISAVINWIANFPGLAGTAVSQSLTGVNYYRKFPGVFDWRLLLAMGLWGMVESIILTFLQHYRNIRLQSHKAERNEKLRREYQEPPPPPPAPAPSPRETLFKKVTRDIQGGALLKPSPADTDPLTRLLNRRAFMDYLTLEMAHARQAQSFIAILMIDFDDFNRLNEMHGRVAGDAVLAQAGMLLKQISPPQGKAFGARFGDEELAILMGDTSPEAAAYMAETIREQIGLIRIPEAPELQVTASIGVYSVRFVPTNGSSGLNERALIAKADAQMYKAKHAGKNRISTDSLP